MSITQLIGDQVRSRIYTNTCTIFNKLNITYNPDDIWHDFAQIDGNGLKAVFYITTVENVKRKDFNQVVEEEKTNNPTLTLFKVKYKRTEKQVRFEINLVNESH